MYQCAHRSLILVPKIRTKRSSQMVSNTSMVFETQIFIFFEFSFYLAFFLNFDVKSLKGVCFTYEEIKRPLIFKKKFSSISIHSKVRQWGHLWSDQCKSETLPVQLCYLNMYVIKLVGNPISLNVCVNRKINTIEEK